MKTRAAALMISLATFVAACGSEVTHDPWTNPELPTMEATADTNTSNPPGAPVITAPERVLARQPINMDAYAVDPDGDAVEYYWSIRAPWLESDLIAEGRGEHFLIDAPVPPADQQVEIEVYARDEHGRRGPSAYEVVEVSPLVITSSLLDFNLINLCLTNCIVVPQLREFDFETTLPTTDELMVHYVGAIHDLAYDKYKAAVDFTPDIAAIRAGAQTVFLASMPAEYQPAANVLLSTDANGSGYAFEVSAKVTSIKGFVTWRWELVELAPNALVQGAGQLSGTVVASGQISNMSQTNTIEATVDGDNLQITFNGLEVVNQPAPAIAGSQIGFGIHNTAASFANTSVTLLP